MYLQTLSTNVSLCSQYRLTWIETSLSLILLLVKRQFVINQSVVLTNLYKRHLCLPFFTDDNENSPRKTSIVAFHASYSKSHLSLKAGNILVFDRVLSNHGSGYSESSGTFRAPVEGTYYFTLHLLASGSKTLHNGIYKNGDIMGYTYAAGTGSQSVVIDLKVGDEVFVKAYVDGLAHGGHYCAFSGFLVN